MAAGSPTDSFCVLNAEVGRFQKSARRVGKKATVSNTRLMAAGRLPPPAPPSPRASLVSRLTLHFRRRDASRPARRADGRDEQNGDRLRNASDGRRQAAPAGPTFPACFVGLPGHFEFWSSGCLPTSPDSRNGRGRPFSEVGASCREHSLALTASWQGLGLGLGLGLAPDCPKL